MDQKKLSPDEEWAAAHSPIHPLKLHALGVITFFWNQCEAGLFLVFAGATKVDANLAFALSHEMGDVTMCNRIREALDLVDHPEDVKELVRHTIRLYDINRQNRNQLTHFMPAPNQSGKLEFWRQKGPRLDPKPFPNELKDVRRVAEEIKALSQHLNEVGWYFLHQPYGNFRRTLPGKPPLPETLWKPPPPNHARPKGPPRSSQA